MAAATGTCPLPGCVLRAHQDDTHRDERGRPWWVAQCGGCGGTWGTYDEHQVCNAACSGCNQPAISYGPY